MTPTIIPTPPPARTSRPKLPLLLGCLLAFLPCLHAAPSPSPAPAFMVGFDSSAVPELEEQGVVYKDGGHPRDIFQILKAHGFNYARLRVWVDPTRDGHNGEQEVLALARRAHDAGLHILLCFHYSDYWADPDHQAVPPAWKNLSFDALNTALREYNKKIVSDLIAQGTPADAAQLGNEINNGILWPVGSSTHLDHLATLLKSAAAGIRDGEAGRTHLLLMIHVAGGFSDGLCRSLAERGVPFDLVGLSYYPRWHGAPDAFAKALAHCARSLHKPVLIVETDASWTASPADSSAKKSGGSGQSAASPESQKRFLETLLAMVRGVPDHQGVGVFYWGGEYVRSSRGLFDAEGNALPALSAFSPQNADH